MAPLPNSPGANPKIEEMVTAKQLETAHSNVKTGADFPAYIREIKALGVSHYEAFVADGHIDYHIGINKTVKTPAKYEPIAISNKTMISEFKAGLLDHQQGKTDFLTFIKMCAETGVEKWEICMNKMTCTYFDSAENEILTENIPQ